MNKENIESQNQKSELIDFFGKEISFEVIVGDKPEVSYGTVIGVYKGESSDSLIVKLSNGLNQEIDFDENCPKIETAAVATTDTGPESPNVQEGNKQRLVEACRYGYEYHMQTQFPEMSFDDNCKNNFLQKLKAGQSQHSYTEAEQQLKYENDGLYIRINQLENEAKLNYSEDALLAIIEQVKQKCANEATICELDYNDETEAIPGYKYYNNDGFFMIHKPSITDIDFKYLLK